MSSPSINLYDMTIPLLVRNLEQLQHILTKAEQWAQDNNQDPQSLIEARIIDDMHPLPYQIHTCCNTAKNVLARIGGQQAQHVQDNEKTFAEFATRIEATIALLRAAAEREKFVNADYKVKVKSGPFEADMDALGYIQRFCFPNFFFHMTTAYDILRKEGVPLGKMDFLGGETMATWTM